MGGDGEEYDVAGYDGVSNDLDANTYSELRELGGQGHLAAIIEETILHMTAENVAAQTDLTDGVRQRRHVLSRELGSSLLEDCGTMSDRLLG